MKAPDRIIIHKYNITDDGNVVFAWLSKSPDCEPMNHPVEYVRTDAFIDKAEKWLNEHILDYIYAEEYGQGVGVEGELFDGFRKAMKGE